MTVLAFPNITPSAATFGLSSNTTGCRSELNGAGQDLGLPGDIWKCQMTFTNKQGLEANQLRAFLASLRGRAGRFTMVPPGYRLPFDVARITSWTSGGTITASASAAVGDSTISATDVPIGGATGYWLNAGDYIGLLGELKMVTGAVRNVPAGTYAISFVPPLRQAIPSGTAIVTNAPTCKMKLSDNDQAQWQMQPGIIYALSVAAEEAIDL